MSPVIPPVFPTFDPIRVQMPIYGCEMTIWPQKTPETLDQWAWGFPYELHFFAYDYMMVSCDGNLVEIQPHYHDSTFDTFWTDWSGWVTAQAFWGLFPITLGKEKQLIQGILVTLDAIGKHIQESNPTDADKIFEIHAYLEQQVKVESGSPDHGTPYTSPISGIRGALSERVWQWKLRRMSQECPPNDT